MPRVNVTVRISLDAPDTTMATQAVQDVLTTWIESDAASADASAVRVTDFHIKRAACDNEQES
jgi:hypothetical protein